MNNINIFVYNWNFYYQIDIQSKDVSILWPAYIWDMITVTANCMNRTDTQNSTQIAQKHRNDNKIMLQSSNTFCDWCVLYCYLSVLVFCPLPSIECSDA